MGPKLLALIRGIVLGTVLITPIAIAASFWTKPFGNSNLPDISKPFREGPSGAFGDLVRPSLTELDSRLTAQRKAFIDEAELALNKTLDKRTGVVLEGLDSLSKDFTEALNAQSKQFLAGLDDVARKIQEDSVSRLMLGFGFAAKVFGIVFGIAIGGLLYVRRRMIRPSLVVGGTVAMASVLAVMGLEEHEARVAENLACANYPSNLASWSAYQGRAAGLRRTDAIATAALTIRDLAVLRPDMGEDLGATVQAIQSALVSKYGHRSRDLDLIYATQLHKSSATRLQYFFAAQVAAEALTREPFHFLCEMSEGGSPFSVGALSVLDAYLLFPFSPGEFVLLTAERSEVDGRLKLLDAEATASKLLADNKAATGLTRLRSTEELSKINQQLARTALLADDQTAFRFRLVHQLRMVQLYVFERYSTALFHHLRAVRADLPDEKAVAIDARDAAATDGIEAWARLDEALRNTDPKVLFDPTALRLALRPEVRLRLAHFVGASTRRREVARVGGNPANCTTTYEYRIGEVSKEELAAHESSYAGASRGVVFAAVKAKLAEVSKAVKHLELFEKYLLEGLIESTTLEQGSTRCRADINPTFDWIMLKTGGEPGVPDLSDVSIASTQHGIIRILDDEGVPLISPSLDAGGEALWMCDVDCEDWDPTKLALTPLSIRIRNEFIPWFTIEDRKDELSILYRLPYPRL